jgi:L-arabinose isomerase
METPLLRVGLFGIGLDAYWPQFAGLKERLEGYLDRVAQKLGRPGVRIVNAGLVDNLDRAHAAGREFRRQEVDIIFLHVTTYALSSTMLPVVMRAKVPVVLLNLAPEPAIDYVTFNALRDRTRMTGEWLAHCAACPVPEIANVFKRVGVRVHQVTGVLDDDPACWREVDAWVEAARVAAGLFGSRLGLMGHYYSGMLDIQSDVTLFCSAFGTDVEHEVDELSARRREVTAAESPGAARGVRACSTCSRTARRGSGRGRAPRSPSTARGRPPARVDGLLHKGRRCSGERSHNGVDHPRHVAPHRTRRRWRASTR